MGDGGEWRWGFARAILCGCNELAIMKNTLSRLVTGQGNFPFPRPRGRGNVRGSSRARSAAIYFARANIDNPRRLIDGPNRSTMAFSHSLNRFSPGAMRCAEEIGAREAPLFVPGFGACYAVFRFRGFFSSFARFSAAASSSPAFSDARRSFSSSGSLTGRLILPRGCIDSPDDSIRFRAMRRNSDLLVEPGKRDILIRRKAQFAPSRPVHEAHSYFSRHLARRSVVVPETPKERCAFRPSGLSRNLVAAASGRRRAAERSPAMPACRM